jgi:thiamine biosynthesis lipoprotein
MTSALEPPGRRGVALEGRAKILLPLALGLLVAFSAYRLACAPPPPAAVEFTGSTMGTVYSVKVAAPDLPAESRQVIRRAIEGRLDRVDRLMSTYRADSELSRFNRHRANEPFPAAPETLDVFRVAREVSELSGGAFDVTVGALVTAWGFGATDRNPAPPPEAEIARLRALVGFEWIEIDEDAGTLTRTPPGAVCDLSAIAKGYAVDRVAAALRELGYGDFLVEIGGEVRAQGRRPDGAFWRVAIETPDSEPRGVFEVGGLRGIALATSGDYRNYYEVGGRRISHTIDPRTGRPVEHALASVSVLHSDAVYADALATALNVLGPEAGYALAEREGLAAYFIVRQEDGSFTSLATPAFERARVPPSPPSPEAREERPRA